jgi:hypothetical protein
MSSRWNALWAAPWGLASWLVVELIIFLPLFFLGLVLDPFWWAPQGPGLSRINSGSVITVFRWTWAQTIWGNWEDGLLPPWWSSDGHGIYSWFVRNPVCNMRFWPVVSTLPKPSVKWIGTANEVPANGIPGWFLAWQGPYVGFLWQCSTWGVWLGWKLNPRDAQPDAPKDYRSFGLGTACQIMRF